VPFEKHQDGWRGLLLVLLVVLLHGDGAGACAGPPGPVFIMYTRAASVHRKEWAAVTR
jgi:hypothetical protein